ncbi:hypothetical protein JYU34_004936, partial [Plutella xylostella]
LLRKLELQNPNTALLHCKRPACDGPCGTKEEEPDEPNIYVSLVLSILGVILCVTMPLAILETPCEVFREKKWSTLYLVTKWVQEYTDVIDSYVKQVLIVLSRSSSRFACCI